MGSNKDKNSYKNVTHILVKWLDEDNPAWDVLPAQKIVKESVAFDIISKKLRLPYVTDIIWHKEKEPAPGTILEMGKASILEKKLHSLVAEHEANVIRDDDSTRDLHGVSECEISDNDLTTDDEKEKKAVKSRSKKRQAEAIFAAADEKWKENFEAEKHENQRLKLENEELKGQLKDLRNIVDIEKIAKNLRKASKKFCSPRIDTEKIPIPSSPLGENLNRSFSNKDCNTGPSSSGKTHIGNGIYVEKGKLASLLQSCGNNANKFGRGLLMLLFSPEQLVGKSLSGRRSNAHLHCEEKEQLDPAKLNALFEYTSRKFENCNLGPLRSSLANKIKEMTKEK